LSKIIKVEQCEYTTIESVRDWLITYYGKDLGQSSVERLV
jgi:hypothetical protein